MPLLSLKNIGKIYVSEGNVSVGIRGVNLDFDVGEFVAITGKSGSGKSTLLNVISGMDTYEEGEMYIDGEPTSHYLQPDFEKYREKYISFVFQDYNIIESFTVLQNVELALMNIESKKERRSRALQLIERVGLSSHIHTKGSKLSGGQKQRTVIARALAKDSPIILADEPTGNLDSKTSCEIIELMREVSRDKLLIMVTHNFEDVEHIATRHIRIFDGSVESDRFLVPKDKNKKDYGKDSDIKRVGKSENSHEEEKSAIGSKEEKTEIEKSCLLKEKFRGKCKEGTANFKNGLHLGRVTFFAKPKLSSFLSVLLIVGMLGVFFMTSLSAWGIRSLFSKNYMFTRIDGRVVATLRDGSPMSEERVRKTAEKYGANSYLHYDKYLDINYTNIFYKKGEDDEYVKVNPVYNKKYGEKIIGRYPQSIGEVFLYLPIGYKNDFGKDKIKIEQIELSHAIYRVVGVAYYVDNNLPSEILFTEEGFKVASAIDSFRSGGTVDANLIIDKGNSIDEIYGISVIPSFALPKGKIHIEGEQFREWQKNRKESETLKVNTHWIHYANYGEIKDDIDIGSSKNKEEYLEFCYDDIIEGKQEDFKKPEYIYGSDFADIYVSAENYLEMMEKMYEDSYSQFSLFFDNNKEAERVAKTMQEEGFIALTTDETYSYGSLEILTGIISGVFIFFTWILVILFISFFINICSSKVISAFKPDMAIMRSMGIPVKVIRISMYFRMLICLVPAVFMMILTGFLIFKTPLFNKFFNYIYPLEYLFIFLGVFLMTLNVTHKQLGKIFDESVKKSLKGGSN